MPQWYILKTKPKKEKEVLGQLSRAGFELFLPQIQGIHSPKPLFPSYLFIETDFQDPYRHRMVRYTRGVQRILGDMEGPQPVSVDIVETIRKQTRDGSLIERDLLLREGDTVRVKKGVLKDLIGMIEKRLPDSKRVQILFKWLSGTMRAKVKYTDLEKE